MSGSDLRRGKKAIEAVDDKIDEAADVVGSARRTPVSDTKQLAKEAHSVLDPVAQKHKSTAIGEAVDVDGKKHLLLSSSDPTVPAPQKKWAKENGIEIVQGPGHAEETLVNAVDEDLFLEKLNRVDAESPLGGLCTDCEGLLNSRNIETNTPATGKKARKRR